MESRFQNLSDEFFKRDPALDRKELRPVKERFWKINRRAHEANMRIFVRRVKFAFYWAWR